MYPCSVEKKLKSLNCMSYKRIILHLITRLQKQLLNLAQVPAQREARFFFHFEKLASLVFSLDEELAARALPGTGGQEHTGCCAGWLSEAGAVLVGRPFMTQKVKKTDQPFCKSYNRASLPLPIACNYWLLYRGVHIPDIFSHFSYMFP